MITLRKKELSRRGCNAHSTKLPFIEIDNSSLIAGLSKIPDSPRALYIRLNRPVLSSYSPLFFFKRVDAALSATMEFATMTLANAVAGSEAREEKLDESGAVSERLTIKLNPIQVVFSLTHLALT